MEKLIYRSCPNCYADKPSLLFTIRFDDFISGNPIFIQSWFCSLGFSKDTRFEFVKCSICDFMYSQRRLSDKLTYEYYHNAINKEYGLGKIYSVKKRIRHLSIWHNLISIYTEFRGISKLKLKVLDFGAGWGDFLSTVKSPGVEVFALEFDENKIEFCRSHGISAGNLDFIKKNAPFDIFMCDQVLEHLENPRASLKTLRSLLAKEAIGFVRVPNFGSQQLNSMVKKIGSGEKITKSINPWGHLNYFTPRSLRKMLFDSGFTELRIQFTPELIISDERAKSKSFLPSRIRAFLRFQKRAFLSLIDTPKRHKHGTTVYLSAIE